MRGVICDVLCCERGVVTWGWIIISGGGYIMRAESSPGGGHARAESETPLPKCHSGSP